MKMLLFGSSGMVGTATEEPKRSIFIVPSLADIVRSERYWEVQREIHKVDLRFCETNCRQHAINKTLDGIMKQPDPGSYVDSLETSSNVPQHVNFI